MAPVHTEPNQRLQHAVSEAGLSNKGLARRVVELGRSYGIEGLCYDHTSVGRWFAGQQPRHPAPELIADVLSRELQRNIEPTELGMRMGPLRPGLGLDFSHSSDEGLATVTALWRGDIEQRRVIHDASFAVGVSAAPAIRWLTAPSELPDRTASTSRVGMAEVNGIRDITVLFRKLDNQWGGGHTRATAVRYLNDQVPQLLHGSYTESTGRALMSAVAELTHLTGWMAFDLELHGLAQRYLIQALRLAHLAGDIALGGEILAGMSQQALYVGHLREAVDLARAAHIGGRKSGLPTLLAESFVTEARALARLGERTAGTRAIVAAERALDGTDRSKQPAWMAYFDHAYLSAQLGHCLRDLGDLEFAEQHAHRSLRMTQGYTRGKAFNLILLADIHTKQHEIEEACKVGHQALDLAIGVKSERARHRMHDLYRHLTPHRGSTPVRTFAERYRELTLS